MKREKLTECQLWIIRQMRRTKQPWCMPKQTAAALTRKRQIKRSSVRCSEHRRCMYVLREAPRG